MSKVTQRSLSAGKMVLAPVIDKPKWNEDMPWPWREMLCVVCGTSFAAKNSLGKFCSYACHFQFRYGHSPVEKEMKEEITCPHCRGRGVIQRRA